MFKINTKKILALLCCLSCLSHSTMREGLNHDLRDFRSTLRNTIVPLIQEAFGSIDDIGLKHEFALEYKQKIRTYVDWVVCSLEANVQNYCIKNGFFDVRREVQYPFGPDEKLADLLHDHGLALSDLVLDFLSKRDSMCGACKEIPWLDPFYAPLTLADVVSDRLFLVNEVEEVLKALKVEEIKDKVSAEAQTKDIPEVTEETQEPVKPKLSKYARRRAAKKEQEEHEKEQARLDQEAMALARTEALVEEWRIQHACGLWHSRFAANRSEAESPSLDTLLFELLKVSFRYLFTDLALNTYEGAIQERIAELKVAYPTIISIDFQGTRELIQLRHMLTNRHSDHVSHTIEQAINQLIILALKSLHDQSDPYFEHQFAHDCITFNLKEKHHVPGRLRSFALYFQGGAELIRLYAVCMNVKVEFDPTKARLDLDGLYDVLGRLNPTPYAGFIDIVNKEIIRRGHRLNKNADVFKGFLAKMRHEFNVRKPKIQIFNVVYCE